MQAVFDKNTGNFSYREINGDNYRLRKERVFVFENERLDDILQEMARWYDFDIFYQNPDMADKQFGLKLVICVSKIKTGRGNFVVIISYNPFA